MASITQKPGTTPTTMMGASDQWVCQSTTKTAIMPVVEPSTSTRERMRVTIRPPMSWLARSRAS